MGKHAKSLLMVGSIGAIFVAFMEFAWIGRGPGTAIFLLAVSVACIGVGVLLRKDD